MISKASLKSEEPKEEPKRKTPEPRPAGKVDEEAIKKAKEAKDKDVEEQRIVKK